MNSRQESESISILKSMINELRNYKRDREVILAEAVKKRLNESLAIYYRSLELAQERLEYSNNLKVIRNLNKYE